MTINELWHCIACGMQDIAHTFERCPSCWKDRPIMPKISATSGPSDINTMPDETAEELVTAEEPQESAEDATAEAPAVELVSAMQVPQDETEGVTEPDAEEAPAETAPAVESAAPVEAPAPMLDVPFSLPAPTKDSGKNA